MHDLAIVIPAYKIRYLGEALSSLAGQTNQSFQVYVGDDASPSDIKAVCDQYKGVLNLHYHRFETNLGGKDLVQQWERCVSLINAEKWLWLFSDDDTAEPKCVERFYEALKITDEYYDVYRFNVNVIDKHGALDVKTPLSPESENAMSLALNILLCKRGNSMPEHIFRFTKYKKLQGFVNFPFGQAADWATSINFAYEKGLYTIAGPIVNWRKSDHSLSTLASKYNRSMIWGHIRFIEWINKKFNEADEKKYNITTLQIRDASLFNLQYIIETHYLGIPYSQLWKLAKKISQIYRFTLFQSFKLCFNINYKLEVYNLKVKLKPLFVKVGLMKQ